MNIQDLAKLYGMLPQAGAFRKVLEDASVKNIFLTGLVGSAAPMLFSTLRQDDGKKKAKQAKSSCVLLILNDADEAGYFYNDLLQLLPNADDSADVLFFPSSYRRAVKYGQRDAANEILRTEVLARLTNHTTLSDNDRFIVTYPEALAELVVSQNTIDERIIKLSTGQTTDIIEIEHLLREFGFQETDYVYEPGQFAIRGSILDVYSFSCELPYRIDFFGDEIESIRTFEVQDQLSKEKKKSIEIVPELALIESEKVPVSTTDFPHRQ